MALTVDLLTELEPSVHNLIKRQLGFSEPTLLTASMNCLQNGGRKDEMTKRLGALLDSRRAAKLAQKICETVDEFLLARDLPMLASESRKRHVVEPENGSGSAGPPGVKKAKTGDDVKMTDEQIRAMLSSTLKQIEKRKVALSVPKSGSDNKAISAMPQVPLPPPQVVSLPNPAQDIKPEVDRAKIMAQLQARIASGMAKIGPRVPVPQPPPAAQEGPTAASAQPERPSAIILDEKGRTVDASGQQITLAQHVPTLKANLRAMRRDEEKFHGKEQSSSLAGQSADEAKFFDGRLSNRVAGRQKRAGFAFNEPGRYQKEGQRMRMKAQLEKLQADISTNARKTGIQSAVQLAKLVPKGDSKGSTPDVEWWDALILANGHSSGYTVEEIRQEAITSLIEHPIQLKPLEPVRPEHVPVFLTKKEQKKLRRQNRREAWKEKLDKIRLGIVQPDQPKVKISNMMRVLESDAVLDPTKVEAHVRAQMAKRLANHAKANAERKLTDEQRKEKNARKLKEDTTGGVHVAVYRVKSLNNPSKKFKVETNAKQLYMTGTVVLYEDVNVVVVEGGPKQQKKYKQLMMNRIKWQEETFKDKDGDDVENDCVLVWEGETKERCFGDMKFKHCPTESFAREHFKAAGVEHYWDQAYSVAVLENTESL